MLPIVEAPQYKDIHSYITWLNKIASKWRRIWEENRLYQASPSSKPKFYITAAFPYPNGMMHLGHARTYTLTDIYARYKRSRGFNVLFPMGFHYTGTPVLAMADKIKEGDKATLKLFKELYRIPDEVIEKMKDPLFLVRYFHEKIRESMKIIGLSIDWRREFTSIDLDFSSFIRWQFNKLYEKGFITQGTHPVGWDPVVGTPVSSHDTKGDVEPEIVEFTLLFFTLDDGTILPAATLRPETVFGAVNIWVNPSAVYVKACIDGKNWILSKEAAYKLGFQLKKIEVIEEFKGEKLVGLRARNPATGWRVPVLPAVFVDPDTGTGIVMSVPAHAPYDYVALKDIMKQKDLLLKLGIKPSELQPIPVIEVPGRGNKLAVDVVESMKIDKQTDREALDKATKEVYSIEFKQGRMLDDIAYRVLSDINDERLRSYVIAAIKSLIAGKPVAEARDATAKWLSDAGLADKMYEIANGPVYSRWGNKVVVKILENQWFLDYGKEEWKKLAREALASMRIIPPGIRKDFSETIEWFQRRACARTRGLGTKLPWDEEWVIESLSDSTIYMAFYTINYILRNNGIGPEKLTPDVWDYILLGKGSPREISKKTGVPVNVLMDSRKEFEYWYPLDSRHSAKDLVKNHLTFFIFNHAAIFPKDKWPRQIVVYGYVMYRGQKMSKSLFNVIPVEILAKQLSPDGLRITIALSSEIDQDLDFREETAYTLIEQLRRIHTLILSHKEIIKEYRKKPIPTRISLEDSWIISKIKERLDHAAEMLEGSRIRDAGNTIFYIIEEDIKKYIDILKTKKRYLDEESKVVLAHIFDAWIRAMAPYTPFYAEELWSTIGGEGFVVEASWPIIKDEFYSEEALLAMEYIDRLVNDIREIIRVRKKKPREIIVHVVKPGEYRLLWKAIEYIEGNKPMKEYIREVVSEALNKKKAGIIARQVYELASSLPPKIRHIASNVSLDEKGIIKELGVWIEKLVGAPITVYYQGEKDAKIVGREKPSLPLKPAIYIEFYNR
mgnify:CR=1 FL=1